MTIQWGAYESASGTGMRAGIQIETQSSPNNGSTTFVVTFTCWVQPGMPSGSSFNDNQTFDLSASAGGLDDNSIAWLNTSNNQQVQQAGPQTITLTYTYPGGSYGTSPDTITISGQVNGVFNGITPNCSVNVVVPARPWANPAPPTGASAARVSDTQASVLWTNNDSTSAKYANIKLYRRDDAGSWALRATLGVVTSYADTSVTANHKYRFRPNVLGSNGVEVTGPETGDIWTTPGAPSALVATKLGNNNIRLDWTNNVNYSEYTVRIEESQNGGAFSELTSVSGGVATYEHVAPSTSVTHTYRVRARSNTGALNSAYSPNSNTIVLLADANPPTGLLPTGTARDATAAIVLSWQHNPADGTPQTKYQLQYKVGAGAYTTVGPVNSAVSSHTLAANTLANGNTITWRVATAGQNGTVSAYSAESVFTTSAVPTAAISSPGDPYNSSTLTVVWTYFQEQSSPQAQYTASLFDGADVLLEQISGGAETSGTFTTPLADVTTYRVTVVVTSAAGLTSAPAEQVFTVQYLPPADVAVSATYDSPSGAMVLTVIGDDPVGGVTVPIATVDIERRINEGPWITIASGLVLSGDPLTVVVLDTAPTIRGTNTYRVTAFSSLPSSVTSPEEVRVTAEKYWSFLSAGPGFGQIVRMKAAPNFSASASRERALHHFAGRPKPVAFDGEAVTLSISVSGSLRESSSTVEEYEAIATAKGTVLWREPSGRRIYATLHGVDTSRENYRWADVSFNLTEIDYTE